MYVPALRLPPVGLLVEEKAKEDPPDPTPPNPGPPPKPVEESDRGSQCSAPAHWATKQAGSECLRGGWEGQQALAKRKAWGKKSLIRVRDK